VEQVRTALEHAAKSIVLLVRRHGLVCPAVLDYLNIVRPFNDNFEHYKAGRCGGALTRERHATVFCRTVEHIRLGWLRCYCSLLQWAHA
jgi:hypothetical protein